MSVTTATITLPDVNLDQVKLWRDHLYDMQESSLVEHYPDEVETLDGVIRLLDEILDAGRKILAIKIDS